MFVHKSEAICFPPTNKISLLFLCIQTCKNLNVPNSPVKQQKWNHEIGFWSWLFGSLTICLVFILSILFLIYMLSACRQVASCSFFVSRHSWFVFVVNESCRLDQCCSFLLSDWIQKQDASKTSRGRPGCSRWLGHFTCHTRLFMSGIKV